MNNAWIKRQNTLGLRSDPTILRAKHCQHCTALHCTAEHCTALDCTLLWVHLSYLNATQTLLKPTLYRSIALSLYRLQSHIYCHNFFIRTPNGRLIELNWLLTCHLTTCAPAMARAKAWTQATRLARHRWRDTRQVELVMPPWIRWDADGRVIWLD